VLKRSVPIFAGLSCAVCAVCILWPASDATSVAVAYAGICLSSGLALPFVSKPRRRLAFGAMLLGALGILVSCESRKLERMQPLQAGHWIQWPATNGGDGHFYSLTPAAANWIEAEKLAAAWGGTLATIHSEAGQRFLNGAFLTGDFEHLPLWIGLFDRATNGTMRLRLRNALARFGVHRERFAWVTGERLSYTNWKSGEPNNSPPGEYYVTVNWEFSDDPPRGVKGDWNDTPVDGTTGYGGRTTGPYFGIIERDTDPKLPLPRIPYSWRAGTLAGLALLAGLGKLAFKPRRT